MSLLPALLGETGFGGGGGSGLSDAEVRAIVNARYTDPEKEKLLNLNGFLEKTVHVPGEFEDELTSSNTTHSFPVISISEHHQTLRTSGGYEVIAKLSLIAFPTQGNTNGLEAIRFEVLDGASASLDPIERTSVVHMPNEGEEYTLEHTVILPADLNALIVEAQRVGNGQSIEIVSLTAEVYLGAIPLDGSVTTAKLADNSVTLDKAGFFSEREEIVTPGQDAIAAVAAAAATLEYNAGGASQQRRMLLTAKEAGAAGNNLRFQLRVAVSGEIASTMVVSANGFDYAVLLDPGLLTDYTISNILTIINSFGASAKFTAAAVDNQALTIASPHVALESFTGGVDGVSAVPAVDEVRQTIEPSAGQVLEFTSVGAVRNSELGLGVSYGPTQSVVLNFTSARVLYSTGITLKSELCAHVFNTGRRSFDESITLVSARWNWFNHLGWLNLSPDVAGHPVAPNTTLYTWVDTGSVYFGRTSEYELLLASSSTATDLNPFSIKEVLS